MGIGYSWSDQIILQLERSGGYTLWMLFILLNFALKNVSLYVIWILSQIIITNFLKAKKKEQWKCLYTTWKPHNAVPERHSNAIVYVVSVVDSSTHHLGLGFWLCLFLIEWPWAIYLSSCVSVFSYLKWGW